MKTNLFQRLKLSNALHYDFCPWMNAYVYWLRKPIGWLVVALVASLLLGIFVSKQSFLAAAAIGSLGLIGCLWPWIAMFGIRGRLSWSQLRCEEDEAVETVLTITNRWPWPAWGLVAESDDAISSQVDAPEEPICLSRVSAMSESTFEWKCRPGVRGVYPQKKTRLTTAFPFGLWTCSRELEVPRKLIVWPRRVHLSDVPERSGALRSAIGSSSSLIGNEGDWMGVRPYRPGDSLRQVHWAQTARRDSLVVFERQSHSRQNVSVWLDPVSMDESNAPQREWLLRILATVTYQFAKHAWDVQACLNGEWSNIQASATGQQEWLDRLARWQPSSTSDDSASHGDSKRASKRVFVICSAPRVFQLIKQFDRNSWEAQWVVLDTRCDSHFASSTPLNSPIQIDDQGDHAAQICSQWNRYCQRTLQAS